MNISPKEFFNNADYAISLKQKDDCLSIDLRGRVPAAGCAFMTLFICAIAIAKDLKVPSWETELKRWLYAAIENQRGEQPEDEA